jgi:hypothetical protein
MRMALNDVQFAILDALYFPEPFEKVTEEVPFTRPVVLAELRQLLHQRMVQALRWDDTARDYLATPHVDFDCLPEYRFLATKTGLLAHNGR